ncbi:MAG: M20/M25/M40 family metallo-hydrolase [Candidatus Dormibacteraeota bacterium]|nr:M20/M25/M40 family metallo-hydrolase [Candidatus Dormibacteraeota bacterium]
MSPAELLQRLIRFDTTNPPGNERACVEFIGEVLTEAGIEWKTYAARPERPNLVARIPGGSGPGLILQGHVDVVTTVNQKWTRPPFAGELVDGWIWGRGALDMKNGVAMMVSAFIRAKRESVKLPGDLILVVLADEEAGGVEGAAWLTDQHPELFAGVQFTIGELGGYSRQVASHRFYDVMVSEKRGCQLRLTVRGPGGHGSVPMREGAMAKLGEILVALNSNRLPVHHTAAVKLQLEGMAAALGEVEGEPYRRLLDPALTDQVLDELGPAGRPLDAVLHNTVNATMVEGGLKINVIPSDIHLSLDGRLLPGFGPEDLIAELRTLVGDRAEIEVVNLAPAQPEPDLSRFDVLAEILRELDPQAVPVPYLVSGGTDGRHFAKLGIRTYGFTPVRLPGDFEPWRTIHDADERIPAEGLDFGTEAIFRAIQRL